MIVSIFYHYQIEVQYSANELHCTFVLALLLEMQTNALNHSSAFACLHLTISVFAASLTGMCFLIRCEHMSLSEVRETDRSSASCGLALVSSNDGSVA